MASWWVGLCLLFIIPANGLLPGGRQNLPPDSPEAIRACHLALRLYNQQDKVYTYSTCRVISAQSQVVAGTMYYLNIEAERCAKWQSLDNKFCPERHNAKPFFCHFELWEKPWENKNQLVKSTCHPLLKY